MIPTIKKGELNGILEITWESLTIFMRPLDPTFLPVVATGWSQVHTPSKHGFDQSFFGMYGVPLCASAAVVHIETAKIEE
jgi:hypothetical protein